MYRVPPCFESGRWEVVASSIEDIEAEGERLKRSLKAADQNVSSKILDEFVPFFKERVEEQERWRRAREKIDRELKLSWGMFGGR